MDFVTNGVGDGLRIGAGTDDNRLAQKGEWLLEAGSPESGLGSGAAGLIFYVADDAYDAEPVFLFGVVVPGDALADGVFGAPVFHGHGAVDDDDGRRAGFVGRGEEASVKEGNAKGAEVVGRSHVITGVELVSGRGLLALDVEAGVLVVSGPREIAASAGRFDAGNGREICGERVVEMLDLLGGLVFRIGQRDSGGEDVVFAESGIEMHEVQQAAQHEAGANEEHAGQGDFGNDERVTKTAEASAGGGESATFMQAASRIGARGLDGGDESEENACGRADDERKGEDGCTDVDLMHAGEIGGEQGDQRLYAGCGQDEADGAPDEGDEDALGEQLANEAAAGRRQGRGARRFPAAATRLWPAKDWRRWRRR